MHWDVHYVETTGSTNTDVLALARSGAPAGTVLRAGHQTGGRGRLGRSWVAPPGSSLLASILLDPEPVPFTTVARVALATGDACRDLTGVEAVLKWPNDLLVGERKLAGLLAEADSGIPGLVVGLGCNVSWPPSDELPEELRETLAALSSFADPVPSPAELLDVLLGRLDGWLACPSEQVLDAYRTRCATLGRAVRVSLPDRIVEGTADSITRSGELQVQAGAGRETLRVGDVVHVRGS